MSTSTPRLGLVKPSLLDQIDYTVIASNLDKIDNALVNKHQATYLHAFVDMTSTTTPTSVGAGLSVKTNKVYMLNGTVFLSMTATSTGATFSLAGVALSSDASYGWQINGISASGLVSPTATLTMATTAYPGAAYDIRGIISPTADGTLNLNVGPSTVVSGTLEMSASSFWEVIEVE